MAGGEGAAKRGRRDFAANTDTHLTRLQNKMPTLEMSHLRGLLQFNGLDGSLREGARK